MLSKKQLEHLERRLQSERDKAIKALGRFGRRTKLDREVIDSDLSIFRWEGLLQGEAVLLREAPLR